MKLKLEIELELEFEDEEKEEEWWIKITNCAIIMNDIDKVNKKIE